MMATRPDAREAKCIRDKYRTSPGSGDASSSAVCQRVIGDSDAAVQSPRRSRGAVPRKRAARRPCSRARSAGMGRERQLMVARRHGVAPQAVDEEDRRCGPDGGGLEEPGWPGDPSRLMASRTWSGRAAAPLGGRVQDLYDYVAIMDYRSFAEGRTASPRTPKTSSPTATGSAVRLMIGVETLKTIVSVPARS